jgi:tRNA1Val (adenine37-N6)-methyltransferase
VKPFQFQQFQVQQSATVFRIGTDAVLLGALCTVNAAENILEVGTGTGIIALMLAQRNPKSEISALDIDENAVRLAGANFKNSKFSHQLICLLQDFKTFQSDKKFDLIVSNPPYFLENESSKDVLARQRITLDFGALLGNAAKLLSENGILSLIIPSLFAQEIIDRALVEDLYLVKKINLIGRQGGVAKRTVLEFSSTQCDVENIDFVIEKKPRIYSDEYLALTQDFHVFG